MYCAFSYTKTIKLIISELITRQTHNPKSFAHNKTRVISPKTIGNTDIPFLIIRGYLFVR